MNDDMSQQKQRREVTGRQESSAQRVERAQEGQDAEITAKQTDNREADIDVMGG